MRHTIALLLILLLSSCFNDGQKTVPTGNANFKVELLFEVDGCRVYRFEDGGSVRYFTSCQGSVGFTDKHGNYDIETSVVDTTSKLR